MNDSYKFPPLALLKKHEDSVIDCDIREHSKRCVYLHEILESEEFKSLEGKLPIVLGVDESDNGNIIESLRSISNLLIGGNSGTEIAAFLKCIILSLLYSQTPDDMRLVLIDSTGVEFSTYNKISKQYLVGVNGYDRSVLTSAFESVGTLESLCNEMARRYNIFSEMHIRDIDDYNKEVSSRESLHVSGNAHLPYLVVVIYEIRDLMVSCRRNFEISLCRLAQYGRVAGIHLIIATHQPTVNVITGMIKANFARRVSFKLSSKADSKTLLDKDGAELLGGHGDMLYNQSGEVRRLHSFVGFYDEEKVCEWIALNNEEYASYDLPDFIDKQSDVFLQREKKVMEELKDFGILGLSKPKEVRQYYNIINILIINKK